MSGGSLKLSTLYATLFTTMCYVTAAPEVMLMMPAFDSIVVYVGIVVAADVV